MIIRLHSSLCNLFCTWWYGAPNDAAFVGTYRPSLATAAPETPFVQYPFFPPMISARP